MRDFIKVIFFICILIPSCKSNTQLYNKDLKVIDVAGGVGKGRLANLTEVADSIEYIPLETNLKSIINAKNEWFHSTHRWILYEKDIVYFPQKTGSIKIFNSKGKFVSTFDRLGKGPQEYYRLGKPHIDNASGKIIINPTNKVVEYSLNGEFIRNVTPPQENEVDNSFFGSNCLKLGDYYFYPCYSLSKYSVIITDCSSKVIKKLKYPQEEVDYAKNQGRPFSFQYPYIYLYNESIRLINGNNKYVIGIDKDLSVDTVFIINYGKYNAMNDNSEMRYLPYSSYLWRYSDIIESDNYLFMIFHVGSLSKKPYKMFNPIGKEFINPNSCAFFNKNTGGFTFLDQPEINQIGFVDDIEGGPAIWPKYVSSDNYLISFIPAEEFIAHAKSHQVSEKFKTIADGLKVTDNPVFVKVKLK